MTNTGHTTPRTKNTKTLTLSVLAIILALALALLAGPHRAHAGINFPQIYTVNQSGDQPDADLKDSHCDIDSSLSGYQCTLRAAIEQTNAIPGADAINFDIPGKGVRTISPKSELPEITDAVTINGYSQRGSSVNTLAKGTNAKLMIELNGTDTANSRGLFIAAPDVVIKGLVINRFQYGLVFTDAVNGKVEGNFIGTDPSGTNDPGDQAFGVVMGSLAANNLVGGTLPAARNLISANDGDGLMIGTVSNGNKVSGNLIGTSKDGKSPLGNGYDGVLIGAADNIVGGASPGYSNTIAFNGEAGVSVGSESKDIDNSIVSNSIFSNGLIGIDLEGGAESPNGTTANDTGDADTGPNHLQNHPLLASAKKSATGKTIVKGQLNSDPNEIFTIQLFSNPKGTNEGKKLLGSKGVTTDGSGNVSFAFSTTKKVKLGQNITATATDTLTGDTSEFSAPRKVVAS